MSEQNATTNLIDEGPIVPILGQPDGTGVVTMPSSILQAIGSASVCWSDMAGQGVFLSERASRIADELMANVDAYASARVTEHVRRQAEKASTLGLPRRFALDREVDVSGVSGTGRVADGVLWPDGTASVRWRGEHQSVVFWDRGWESVQAIHGHGGATTITWLDGEA